jgi:hypothetical protein
MKGHPAIRLHDRPFSRRSLASVYLLALRFSSPCIHRPKTPKSGIEQTK